MKNIIVLLGMIVLGTFLVNSIVLGDRDSFKSDANTLGTEAKTQVNTFVGGL